MVFEAEIYNLTKDQSNMLIHRGADKSKILMLDSMMPEEIEFGRQALFSLTARLCILFFARFAGDTAGNQQAQNEADQKCPEE